MFKSPWFYVAIVFGIILGLINTIPIIQDARGQDTVIPTIPCVFHHNQGRSTTIIEGGLGLMYHGQFHCFKNINRKL